MILVQQKLNSSKKKEVHLLTPGLLCSFHCRSHRVANQIDCHFFLSPLFPARPHSLVSLQDVDALLYQFLSFILPVRLTREHPIRL